MHRDTISTTGRVRSVWIIALLLVLLPTQAGAISRHSGYDENTEIVLTGAVKTARVQPYKDLECFVLQARRKLYHILTAPKWVNKRMGLDLKIGNKVKVIGSKFYDRNGKICILAKSVKVIHPGSHTIILRTANNQPVWNSTGFRKASCLRIFHIQQ